MVLFWLFFVSALVLSEEFDYEHEYRPPRRTEHEHDGILWSRRPEPSLSPRPKHDNFLIRIAPSTPPPLGPIKARTPIKTQGFC